MPTAQHQSEPRAFRMEATAVRAGTAAAAGVHAGRPGFAPLPPAPSAAPSSRPRQRVQTAWLATMSVAAALMFMVGLFYLSGHAQVTQEGYRRAKLLGALRRERELAQQWEQQQALLATPLGIETRAKRIGMTRADASETITAGEPTEAEKVSSAYGGARYGSR